MQYLLLLLLFNKYFSNNYNTARILTGTYFASELIHLRRPMIGSELTRPWNENILSRDACDGNFVEINFKYSILSRWEALFAINFHLREINILWPETVNGTMGRWDDSLQVLF